MVNVMTLRNRGNVETLLPGRPRTLEEALTHPFEPLSIHRPMTLFPTALGLQPERRQLPSDDFLANLLTGRRSYLAFVRRGFGRDFKNFENYALQRVRTTAAVHDRLVKAVGGEPAVLELLAGLLRSGVLGKQMAGLTKAGEGFVYQLMLALSSGSCKCTNCGNEMVSRPETWWQDQGCALGEAEYRFVDRVLYDVLAAVAIPLVFESGWAGLHAAAKSLAELCESGSHPFKHWLTRVRQAYRAKDLTALAVRAGLDGQFPDSHLQRCSRGEMLTVDMIEAVTARLPNPKSLRSQGMHARAVAFAVDFLVAADGRAEHLAWQDAQAIVKARITQIEADLRLSTAGQMRQASSLPAAHEPKAIVGPAGHT